MCEVGVQAARVDVPVHSGGAQYLQCFVLVWHGGIKLHRLCNHAMTGTQRLQRLHFAMLTCGYCLYFSLGWMKVSICSHVIAFARHALCHALQLRFLAGEPSWLAHTSSLVGPNVWSLNATQLRPCDRHEQPACSAGLTPTVECRHDRRSGELQGLDHCSAWF